MSDYLIPNPLPFPYQILPLLSSTSQHFTKNIESELELKGFPLTDRNNKLAEITLFF